MCIRCAQNLPSFIEIFTCNIITSIGCIFLTLSSLNIPYSIYQLQAANCCRNYRLVVKENDLMWMAIEKNILLLKKKFHVNISSRNPGFWESKSFFRDAK